MTDESPLELVERPGLQVEADPAFRAQAVQQLVELTDGGLTRMGAESMLAGHRTLRAQLNQGRLDTCRELDKIYGL